MCGIPDTLGHLGHQLLIETWSGLRGFEISETPMWEWQIRHRIYGRTVPCWRPGGIPWHVQNVTACLYLVSSAIQWAGRVRLSMFIDMYWSFSRSSHSEREESLSRTAQLSPLLGPHQLHCQSRLLWTHIPCWGIQPQTNIVLQTHLSKRDRISPPLPCQWSGIWKLSLISFRGKISCEAQATGSQCWYNLADLAWGKWGCFHRSCVAQWQQ